MTGRSLERTRGALSAFLTHHRRRLAPADVGLPSTGRRRTPGLRREEVAALAGVGLTWYTWFEQGRDIQVSQAFLLNVAKALRLDDAECCHLFLLAHRRPPPADAYRLSTISPLIRTLLDELARPAYVTDLRWDTLASNAAGDRLFGFSEREAPERNILRLVFADPAFRRRMPAWGEDAPRLFAQFRQDLATAPDDPAMLSLTEDLKRLSPDFRLWLSRPQMDGYSRGIGRLLDPDGAPALFAHETLTVDEHRHQRMVVYFRAGG
jgi:transcriptional regulator with XRE-family HTH domain